MIAAFGEQLLDWLNKYTFPTERKYADKAFASSVAKVFLAECLKNGITTSCVYCTVFPQSVDALFEEAERLGLRIAAGKVLMNRNAPDYLLDTTQSGYDDSKALIGKWHGRGRLMYAITPRFAPTSTADQLDAAGDAVERVPGLLHADACVGEQERSGLGQGIVPRPEGLPRRLRSQQAVPPARGVRPRHPPDGRRAHVHAPDGVGDLALPDVQLFPRQRLPGHLPRQGRKAARAGRPRHRPRRRHFILDPADAQRGLQGGAAEQPRTDRRARVLSRYPGNGARHVHRRQSRQHCAQAWRPISSC